jgi:SulP family sulfate permease
MSVLAGILITVGIGIIDYKGLRHVHRAPRADAAVMLVVLGLTVLVDLMWAVAVGMVMASLVLVKRLSDMDPATHSPLLDIASHRPWVPELEVPAETLKGIYVVELHGSLFFGNAGPLQRKLGGMKKADGLVFDMTSVRYLDQSGVYALTDLVSDLAAHDTRVYLAGLHEEPRRILENLGVIPQVIPQARVLQTPAEAVAAAAREDAVARGADPSASDGGKLELTSSEA